MENEVIYLYLDDIIPNRFQPRESFDEQAMKELAVSIKEHGVIQPIVVRKIGEKYEIIAGERRYKATTMAGLTKIPAIIRNLDDKESSKVALIENLQRKDLTPIEEARTYQKILELDALTQEELAKTIGKSQSAVSNKLRLLTLTDEVQDALLREKISERHARTLLNVEDKQLQIQLLNKIITTRMTVRELDEEVRRMLPKQIDEIVKAPIETGNIQSNPINLSQTQDLFAGENVKNNVDMLMKASEYGQKSNQESPFIKKINEPRELSTENRNNIINQVNPDISSNFIDINNDINDTSTNLLNNEMNNRNSNYDNSVIGGSGLLAGMPVDITNDKRESIISNINLEPIAEPRPWDINNTEQTQNISANKKDIRTTINEVKSSINRIKNENSEINVEEFDFEDFYQFVIRVDKNN